MDRNCIKRTFGPTSDRELRVSKDIPMKQFLKACKRNDCTVNEATMAILSQTLKEYFAKQGDDKTD